MAMVSFIASTPLSIRYSSSVETVRDPWLTDRVAVTSLGTMRLANSAGCSSVIASLKASRPGLLPCVRVVDARIFVGARLLKQQTVHCAVHAVATLLESFAAGCSPRIETETS